MLFRLLFILLLLVSYLPAQELNQMKIIGKPKKLDNEFVEASVRDVNGRICAAIKIISDMEGFKYQANNGVVKVTHRPGEDIVFLQPDERRIIVYHTGYKPLPIILSEYGIYLQSREIWQIEIKGQGNNANALPVTFLVQPEKAHIQVDGKEIPNGTPVDLSVGKHQLKIALKGYRTVQKEITVDKKNVLFKFTLQEVDLVPVTIKSTPPGAKIFIDDVQRGVTDKALNLFPGTYRLKLMLSGYLPLMQSIEVKENKANIFSFNLTKNAGYLRVKVQPTGATLFLNGKVYPVNQTVELTPGTYQLTVSKNGYLDVNEQIEIKVGETVSRSYTMQKNTGTLDITVNPASARVLLNKEDYSGKSSIELAPGLYRLEISADGYYGINENITIERGQTLNKCYELKQKTGKLSFSVTPADAQAELKRNGQTVKQWHGAAYLKDLPVGEYELEVTAFGYKEEKRRITLDENEMANLDISLNRDIGNKKNSSFLYLISKAFGISEDNNLPKVISYKKKLKILKIPSKYVHPAILNLEDLKPVPDSERAPYPWIVFSDRDENATYISPYSKTLFKKVFYLEKFYVCEEKGEFVHIVKDLSPKEFNLSDKMQDYGWIHKSHLLLWKRALVTTTGHFAKRAMIINTIKQLLNQHGKPDIVEYKSGPFEGSRRTGEESRLFEILFIFKYVDINNDGRPDYYLLGLNERLIGDNIAERRNCLLGWVPKERLTFWGLRIALEPNWDKKAVQERKSKGIKARIFVNISSARNYQKGKSIPDSMILWDNDPLSINRPIGRFLRFPILLDSRGLIKVGVMGSILPSSDKQNRYGQFADPFSLGINRLLRQARLTKEQIKQAQLKKYQVYTRGITTLKVNGLKYPLFKKVLFLSRMELGRLIDIMYQLSDTTSAQGLRDAFQKNWVKVIKNEIGGISEAEIENMTINELYFMLMDIPSVSNMLKDIKLYDILDPHHVSMEDLMRYINEISKKASELGIIFNMDDYPQSFRSNEIRYFWIPIEMFP